MARFEAALASASARRGIFPAAYAAAINQACGEASFDVAALAREARLAGALAIPFVKALTAKVAALSPEAARYVHFGATSQDVMDTAVALCMKQAARRIGALVLQLGDGAAALAQRHAATLTVARTLLQPATPVPFGWKAAMWLAPVARSYPHFRDAALQACVLQFGGAAGTLSAFRDKADGVAKEMARELGLEAAGTWHSARDAFARLGTESAILTGLAAKIARDVALLAQPEVGEAAEPVLAGRGGSSSMPHKRNPAGCLLALEAAARAPGLAATLLGELAPEHERGLGQWQSQWLTLRELAGAAASALAAMAEVLAGLEINRNAMAANLERTNGLVFSEALAVRASRALAERLCEQARREGRHLLDVARHDAEARQRLGMDELEALFQPEGQFGAAGAMIERVLADWVSAREIAA
ncbi:MAG TPA: lyase family protein [Burkholderiales bacterium]|jgi:3-carboxy-cis,cis-muconate cycloisomerase